MSRSFVAASSQLLSIETAPLLAVPFSWACWFKRTAVTANQELLWLGNSASANNYFTMGLVAGAMRSSARNTTELPALTTVDPPAGVWCHACGTFTAANSRAVYLNGGNKGTNSSAATPTGANRFGVGSLARSVLTNFFDGLIAQVSIWNVALSDAEVAQLAAGVPASQVRAAALVFYAPNLGHDSPEIDIVGGFNLTVTGATSSTDEPPMQSDFSGGFLYEYERSMSARQRRRFEQEALEEQAEALTDQVDREIAQLLHAQDSKADEQAELARLQRMVRKYSNGALNLSDRAKIAYVRVLTQANFSALEALDRELQRMLEEEEVAALIMLLNED